MKKVTITEPGGIKHHGQHYHEGDTVTHEHGEYFQKMGWAKCATSGETGERVEGAVRVNPADIQTVLK